MNNPMSDKILPAHLVAAVTGGKGLEGDAEWEKGSVLPLSSPAPLSSNPMPGLEGDAEWERK